MARSWRQILQAVGGEGLVSRRELLDVLGEEDPRGYRHHVFVERVAEHLATRCGIPTTAISGGCDWWV